MAFDRGVHPLLRLVLPDKAEAVLRFRADPELQARIEELAGKSTEGALTQAGCEHGRAEERHVRCGFVGGTIQEPTAKLW